MRKLSPLDRFIGLLDQGINTVFAEPIAKHPYPADAAPHVELGAGERALAARLMRVNHAGEVAAQALFRGHALTAHTPVVRAQMERAADEETDHLAWCARRIEELGSHTSVLNPLWYMGSFAIGALVGKAGDKWSLGFVAETEQQVVAHLEKHLQTLSSEDKPSRAILEQMRQDEAQHATVAIKAGAAALPTPVKKVMSAVARVMTGTAYWV